ncbi:hypothetical protein D3C81_1939520 [compost metagenome]
MPLPSATPVPITLVPLLMVIVLFGSAVPVTWFPAGLRVTVGWPGAIVSTIKLIC